jgi:hypothetical protein
MHPGGLSSVDACGAVLQLCASDALALGRLCLLVRRNWVVAGIDRLDSQFAECHVVGGVEADHQREDLQDVIA